MAANSRKGAAPSPASSDKARTLEQRLATKEIVISCGSGGVGKTTTAAAAAAMAAVSSRVGALIWPISSSLAIVRRKSGA